MAQQTLERVSRSWTTRRDAQLIRQAGSLPSRGQRGAVSGTRKQTFCAFVFWKVRRCSGMITQVARRITSLVDRLRSQVDRANPSAPSADFLSRLSMRKVSDAGARESIGSISCKNQRQKELLQAGPRFSN